MRTLPRVFRNRDLFPQTEVLVAVWGDAARERSHARRVCSRLPASVVRMRAGPHCHARRDGSQQVSQRGKYDAFGGPSTSSDAFA